MPTNFSVFIRSLWTACRLDWRSFASLTAFVILAVIYPTTLSGQAGVIAQKQITRVIDAYNHDNFRELFDAAYYYQAKIQEIRHSNPQVMWQQLIDAEFNSEQNTFSAVPYVSDTDSYSRVSCPGVYAGCGMLSKDPMDGLPFIPSAAPSDSYLRYVAPSVSSSSVLETHPFKWHSIENGGLLSGVLAYVQLVYSPSGPSPIRGEGELQKVIVAVVLQGPKYLYYSSEPVANSAVNLSAPALKIVSIQWIGVNDNRTPDRWAVQLGYSILGGMPPYRSESKCGAFDSPLERIALDTTSPANASIHGSPNTSQPSQLNILTPPPVHQTFPMHCSVKVLDSKSSEDSVEFEVPAAQPNDGRAFCWVNEPWFKWNQGGPMDVAPCHHMPMKDVGRSPSPDAEVTPAKPSDSGPSLEASMQFIRDKLSEKERIEWTETMSNRSGIIIHKVVQHTGATADPASCTLISTATLDTSFDFPDGKVLNIGGKQVTAADLRTHSEEKDTIHFKDIEKISVVKLQDIVNDAYAKAAHPEITATLTPPISYLEMFASNAVFSAHSSSTKGDQAPIEKDFTIKMNGVTFSDEEMANRVANAMIHAVQLCGGSAKQELY